MAKQMQPVDMVIVGGGWTGGIIGKEALQAGIKVVMLERGPYRTTVPDFQPPRIHDELKGRGRTMKWRETSRSRRSPSATNRIRWRCPCAGMGPSARARVPAALASIGLARPGVFCRGISRTGPRPSHRYGKDMMPSDMINQDWGVTYEDMEPYYDKFEYRSVVSGKAGNIKGQIQEGGNPFEGPRSRDYPTPPMKRAYFVDMAQKVCTELGYKVFPQPSATISQAYTNPDGTQLGGCAYCGMCTLYGCEVAAKASSVTTCLPVMMKNPNFELRTHAYVQKVNLDSTGKKATGVTYIDVNGEEVEQPADIVVLAAYALWNVHLMLLSGIGKPYDPKTGQGVVGRNYAYQGNTGASMFFDDKLLNRFMGAGAAGVCIDEFNGDNFDHSGLDFIGGGNIAFGQGGGGPLESQPVPPGTPAWGSDWKKAVAKYYNRSAGFGAQMGVQSYVYNYLDLDPTYKDIFGRPALRLTFNWGPNEHKQSEYLKGVADKIAKAFNATLYRVNTLSDDYSIVPYQSTHNTGGAVMGADPNTSAVNPWLQSWDVPNVFTASAAAFPQNGGYNPTGTVCALAFRAADAIVNKYLKNRGPLA